MTSEGDLSTEGGFVIRHPSNPYWHSRNTTSVPNTHDVPITTTDEALVHTWHHDPAVTYVSPVQTKQKKYSGIL
jgi:hypothetical protein